MTAITITDLTNAKQDVDHIAEIATSQSNTATDRLGHTKNTLHGQMAAVDAELSAKLDNAQSQINVKVNEATAQASAAAGSATSALGYLNTIRATSYGALASDPTVDPLGNPCTVGDEYFNTTLHQMRVYTGSGWMSQTTPADASAVSYLPTGTGAVATTVQAKLRESVSVKDFGAAGDGVTDDTAAIQACWDYCRTNSRTAFVPNRMVKNQSPPSVFYL